MRFLLTALGALVACSAAEPVLIAPASQDSEPAATATDRPVRQYVAPSTWRQLPAVDRDADPIAPLAAADIAALAKPLDAKAMTAFLAGCVDRLEARYAAKAGPGFIAWLATHPELRRDFWLAVSPTFDDIASAMRVLDDLRLARAKAVERLPQLAIAVAVVHDSPDALISARYACIHGMAESQFPKPPGPLEVFDWFADERRAAAFVFKPNQMSWSMMVHLVDLDVAPDERQWALTTQATRRSDIASLYPLVEYDNAKLTGISRLGSLPYSLANLVAKGGICGDQAHFASRVAKSFGVPAMKVSGEGRYGGMGHAWCGFLTAAKGRPVLEFTGRYQYDYYYTGDIFDPQTRTMTLDRYVALGYDGVSLSFAKAQEAAALARAAKATFATDPATSLALAKETVKRNTFCADGWRMLMAHSVSGTLPRKEAQGYASRMLKELAAHPDLTIEGIVIYLQGIPTGNVDERQKLYAAAYALYAQRPDLQVALRMIQCSELVAAKREPDALRTALDTVVRNAKEGTLIMPLVHYVVETSKAFAASTPTFRLDVVKQQLTKAESDFPKQRGDKESPAWSAWRKLVGSL